MNQSPNPGNDFLAKSGKLPVVESCDINQLGSRAMYADVAAIYGKLLERFRPSIVIGTALIASGTVHLTLMWVNGADWSGPLSLRKPGLFGISAGLTVWSIAWVATQLIPRNDDQRFVNALSAALLVEVALITLQQWRGVPSHFNRSTAIDSTIEVLMLGLILFVTGGIAWICGRSFDLRPMPASRVIAIRAGLWLLLVSCGLGILVTLAGEANLMWGRPPEVWGKAGVLKYPHGATLHAIQTLPLLSALLQRFQVGHSVSLIYSAVAAHLLFLFHACWQTCLGRTRMDVDVMSLAALAMAGGLLFVPIFAVILGIMSKLRTQRISWCFQSSSRVGCKAVESHSEQFQGCRK